MFPLVAVLLALTFLAYVPKVLADSTTCISDNVIEDDSVGTEPWNNEADAEGDPDSSGAYCDLEYEEESHYLRATMFGFHEHTPIIPDTATIDGIKVEIRRQAYGTGAAVWEPGDGLRVLKNGEVTDAEDGMDDYYGEGWEWSVGGGPTSLWDGEPWTVADIKNDSGFGVLYYVRGDSPSPQAQVDCFRVTVYYTEAAAEEYDVELSGNVTVTASRYCTRELRFMSTETAAVTAPPHVWRELGLWSWTESVSVSSTFVYAGRETAFITTETTTTTTTPRPLRELWFTLTNTPTQILETVFEAEAPFGPYLLAWFGFLALIFVPFFLLFWRRRK